MIDKQTKKTLAQHLFAMSCSENSKIKKKSLERDWRRVGRENIEAHYSLYNLYSKIYK
jgi:hypothetical protein